MRWLPPVVLVLLLGCTTPGWDGGRPPVDDDDTTVADDDDTTVADDDDTTVADDDDTTPADDDDTTPADDDDATGDDDDATADDDDATGDDDDTTPVPGDGDGDGFAAEDAGGEDCDDTDAAIFPGATEDPTDSVDNDCDGTLDEGIEIAAVVPDNGVEAGGTLVVLQGSGFTGVTSVTFGADTVTASVEDDGTIEVLAPGGAVGDVDVTASHAFDSETAADGFRYTGTTTTLDSATLPSGVLQSTNPGVPSAAFTGTVFDSGVTDGAGPGAGIVGEIGFGPQGFGPTEEPDSWSWSSATFDADDGSGDRWTGTVTPTTFGTYMVTFRFSADDGYNWIYADSDSGTPLDLVEMSQLDVVP